MQDPANDLPSIPLLRTRVNIGGEDGWLKAWKISEYEPRRPEKLQDALLPYLDAI
jgi:hypothetical protein